MLTRQNSFRKNVITSLVYGIIFISLLISYPLHGSLPSDMDSWFYVASFNYYYEFLSGWLHGIQIGKPFYPDPYPYLNGEPSFFIFPIWAFFKTLQLGEIWSYFFTIIVILVINALSVYKLAGEYFPSASQWSKLLTGLFFGINNFVLANIDNPNTIFWGFGILAVLYFRRSLEQNAKRNIILFSCLVLVQLFVSTYNFMYTGIIVISIAVFNFRRLMDMFKMHFKLITVCFLLVVCILVAYIYLLTGVADKSASWNYSTNLQTVKYLSIHLEDLYRVLPGNIYHLGESDVFWAFHYRSLFLGTLLTLMGITGILINFKKRPEFILIIIISFTIGIGTFVDFGEHRVIMPLGFIFETFDLYTFYRFPFRIFLIVSLVLCIASIAPMDYMLRSEKYRWVAIVLLAGIVLLENIPLKRKYFHSDRYILEGKALQAELERQPMSTILFLPSGDFVDGQTYNINRTENIYMYWQTCIKKNIMNGYSSFFPPTRMELNDALLLFENNKQGFADYLLKYKVDLVIYYGKNWGLVDCPADMDAVKQVALENNIRFIAR